MNIVLCFIAFAAVMAAAEVAVDTMKHSIFSVTEKTFNSQVTVLRNSGVVTVLFYRDNKISKTLINGEYNELAKELHGMVKVAALDCSKFPSVCIREGVSDSEKPVMMIYPPQPFTPFPFEGEITKKDSMPVVLRHIPSANTKKLSQDTMEIANAFLATNVAVPKVLLFSSKEQIPVLYNALANNFHDRMSFGFVHESQDKIVKRFKVKTFPTLLIVKGEMNARNTGEVYSGEMKFAALHEWLNVRSETFVKGGGYQSGEVTEEIKLWLTQDVPEMTGPSHQDICFKTKNICVVFCGKPTPEEMEMLQELKTQYAEMSSDRTVALTFSWLDISIETKFANMLEMEPSAKSLAIFKPHKRPRFMTLDPEVTVTKEAIENVLEKVFGGDARFKAVPKNKLPTFTARDPSKTAGDEEPKGDEL